MDPHMVELLLDAARDSMNTLSVRAEKSAYSCHLALFDIELLCSHDIICTIVAMGGTALPDT